jgi:hypothetical protein
MKPPKGAMRALRPTLPQLSALFGPSWTHLASWFVGVHRSRRSCCEGRCRETQVIDPTRDVGEQRPQHRHLGELEHDVATVTHDPGAMWQKPEEFNATVLELLAGK